MITQTQELMIKLQNFGLNIGLTYVMKCYEVHNFLTNFMYDCKRLLKNFDLEQRSLKRLITTFGNKKIYMGAN